MADESPTINQKSKQQLRAERKALQQTEKVAKTNKKQNESDKSVDEVDRAVPAEKTSIGEETKSKQQLRAERKALQQAQKTAKLDKNLNKEEKKVKDDIIKTSGKNVTLGSNSAADNVKPSQVSTNEQAGGKSKAELRAERRKQQEMQRAAKAAKKDAETKPAQPSKQAIAISKSDQSSNVKKVSKKVADSNLSKTKDRIFAPFSHLKQYEKQPSITKSMKLGSASTIHPAIVHLGVQYAQGVIVGSNARCLALMLAFKKVLADYITPPEKELSRDLEAKIKPYFAFLKDCRPFAVSMESAKKYLIQQISRISSDKSDFEGKEILNNAIDDFLQDNLYSAQKLITQMGASKIVDGDVILTYSCSSIIKSILLEAHNLGKDFRVIIVDGRPKSEGKDLLRFLIRNNIECMYVLINSVSYVMPEVTKVMLGAHGLQANGYVMSRIGSSQIALVAKVYNVPVLVCCETYKFCERVQADSIVYNELGDSNDLVQNVVHKGKILKDWKDTKLLCLLNLAYDVTPPNFVSGVITEKGMLPCTSVPVVLRVRQFEI